MPGNHKKEVRKNDSLCSALAGQLAITAATECGFEMRPHPPFSPDMAPSDFYLFPKRQFHIRVTQYGSNEGVIEAVNKYLGNHEKAILKG